MVVLIGRLRICGCARCMWQCWLNVDVAAGNVQESQRMQCLYSVLMVNCTRYIKVVVALP